MSTAKHVRFKEPLESTQAHKKSTAMKNSANPTAATGPSEVKHKFIEDKEKLNIISPISDAVETCKAAVAAGATVVLSHVPGTAEHAVRKGAEQLESEDDKPVSDVNIATGDLLLFFKNA